MNLLTKRLPTLLGLLLLSGIAGGIWWYVQSMRPMVSEESRPTKVRVTNVADNKFTVSWITQESSLGNVEYGAVGEKLATIVRDERDLETDGSYFTHHVIVGGLQPNTQYAFRIISGESRAKFENNGSPYSVTTGRVVGSTPVAESFYGQVKLASGQPQEGAIVYLAIPEADVASTLVTATGNYSIPVSTIRTSDGSGYVKYDKETTIATVSVEDGTQTASATVSMNSVTPVPVITMGEELDFRTTTPTEPGIAEVKPEPVTIFNVEPLGALQDPDSEVVILNPGVEGESIATTLPEFRGLAPEGIDLTITLHSPIPYVDTIIVGEDGTWEWTPPEELAGGAHTITIDYIDAEGIEQTIERTFSVSTAYAAEGDPAFEATPSGGTYASPTPSSTASAVASPRITTPSTESGVPVTGVTGFTWLTGGLGIVIILLGALAMAL